MTGFARSQNMWESYSWVWEIRSVNGRALDIRCRIPSGLDAFDQHIRGILKKALSRGSLNVSLQLQRDSGGVEVRVKPEVLDQLVVLAKDVAKKHDMPAPSIEGLMMIRDVVEISEGDEDEDFLKKRDVAIKKSFDDAVQALLKSRADEGAATVKMLTDLIDEIERLVNQSEEIAGEQPELLKNRFEEKVNALLDDKRGLDAERITQEIVILATKADIKEELDRLKAHIASARKHLADGGIAGRKLDFLTQEFNREANTLCSKAQDIRLTELGLALKTAIDQLREQVQNIE